LLAKLTTRILRLSARLSESSIRIGIFWHP
jgi:hypothetical protein